MIDNFIALVSRFKFERGPAFVLTCDTATLHWLENAFLALGDGESQAPIVVGNGSPISSDERCHLVVEIARGGRVAEIRQLDRSRFCWSIEPKNIEAITGKLRLLRISEVAGHQYLEVERGSFRTVVITKGEYTADIIREMRDGS